MSDTPTNSFLTVPLGTLYVKTALPIIMPVFFISGPIKMIATYFQTIGDAKPAAIMTLSKPYLFAILLTFGLAFILGEAGIWYAGPIAEAMLLALTVAVLFQSARRQSLGWGVFHKTSEATS